MKPLYFTILISLLAFGAKGQLTTLSENFDTDCSDSVGYIPGWNIYNPLVATSDYGAWYCAPLEGRGGTPGIQCTGTYSGSYHLDTSYLITPPLDFSSYYPDSLYLYFDTKQDLVNPDGTLYIYYSRSDTDSAGNIIHDDSTFSATIAPPLYTSDTNWVTHMVNITHLEYGAHPAYITFMYTSPADSGSVLYLDNVQSSTNYYLGVTDLTQKKQANIHTIGASAADKISVEYFIPDNGAYKLLLTNVMGTVVYEHDITCNSGVYKYDIAEQHLAPGLYVVKLYSNATSAVTKAMVQ